MISCHSSPVHGYVHAHLSLVILILCELSSLYGSFILVFYSVIFHLCFTEFVVVVGNSDKGLDLVLSNMGGLILYIHKDSLFHS